MPAIYSSTALKTRQRELKDIAQSEVVYITENGNGKYVFMSQELFDEQLHAAAEDALYEARAAEALRRSRQDYAEGRYTASEDEMWAEVGRRRAAHA